jgi:hypothetical protein
MRHGGVGRSQLLLLSVSSPCIRISQIRLARVIYFYTYLYGENVNRMYGMLIGY